MGKCKNKKERDNELHPVDLKKIHVTDPFWTKVHVSLGGGGHPHQWDANNDSEQPLEPSHSLMNFKDTVAGL